MIATGEQVSSALLAMVLQKQGIRAQSLNAFQCGIQTQNQHGNARVKHIDTSRIHQLVGSDVVPIVCGFQGVNEYNDVTTLGRGGSDTSAVAIAAAMGADACWLYTDVRGIYTADPRVVSSARLLPSLTFDEMLELCSLGSKVIHIRAVEFAKQYSIPLRVLSSFESELSSQVGTLISDKESRMEQGCISGIAFDVNQALVFLRQVPLCDDAVARVLAILANDGVDIDMIHKHATADQSTLDLAITVHRNDSDKVSTLLAPLINEWPNTLVEVNARIGKVSVVGIGMKGHSGFAAKIFSELSCHKINVQWFYFACRNY